MSSYSEAVPQVKAGQKTLSSCITGFALSMILTIMAFMVVAEHHWSAKTMYISLTVLAVAQLLVQVVFFLRMNNSKEGRWNLMPFLFTIVIISVVVGGSLWIMYNLNYNMVN
jgi:cytochrome o ubiquinol oxidase subunit IV